jgi:hypothetical protein
MTDNELRALIKENKLLHQAYMLGRKDVNLELSPYLKNLHIERKAEYNNTLANKKAVKV